MQCLLGWTCAAFALLGCATGSELDSVAGQGSGGHHGVGGQGGAVAGSSSNASAASSSSSSASSGSGGEGGGTECFAAPNQCSGAIEILSIAGDIGSDTRNETGTTSKWFKLNVQETVNSPFTFPPLSYTATLTSPAGMNFDLYIYDGDSTGPNCMANPAKADGDPDAFSEKWNDTVGSDDTKWIVLEVRYASGTDCSGSWSLTVQGDTL
jgi:hypothetical protein